MSDKISSSDEAKPDWKSISKIKTKSLLLFNQVQDDEKDNEEVIKININVDNKDDNKVIVNKKVEELRESINVLENIKVVDKNIIVEKNNSIKSNTNEIISPPLILKHPTAVLKKCSLDNDNSKKNINNKAIDITKLIEKDHLPVLVNIGLSNKKISNDGGNNSSNDRTRSRSRSHSNPKEKRFNSTDTKGSDDRYDNQLIIDEEEYDSDYDKYMNHRKYQSYKSKTGSSSLKSPSLYERKKSKQSLQSKSRHSSQNLTKTTNDELLNTKLKSIETVTRDRVNSKAFDKKKYRNNKIFDPSDPDLLISKLYQLNPRRFNPLGSSSSFFTIAHIGLVFLLSLVVIYTQQQWGNYYRAAGAVSCFFFSPSSVINSGNLSTSSNLYNGKF
jgi:hypothetical protein